MCITSASMSDDIGGEVGSGGDRSVCDGRGKSQRQKMLVVLNVDDSDGGKALRPQSIVDVVDEVVAVASAAATVALDYDAIVVLEAERDGSFIPTLEDELNEVEHLLADPRNEKGFMDGVLCLDLENTGEDLIIDDFQGFRQIASWSTSSLGQTGLMDSPGANQPLGMNQGDEAWWRWTVALDDCLTPSREAWERGSPSLPHPRARRPRVPNMRWEPYAPPIRGGGFLANHGWSTFRGGQFLDGILDGVKEGDLLVSDDLADTCNDFLLDGEFSDKVADLDYGPCEGSDLGSLGLDSNCSLDVRYIDKNVVETLISSTATVVEPESACDQNEFALQKMTIRELQEAFRSTFGRNTSVKDKQWLKRHITCGLKDLTEFDNVSCPSESSKNSNEDEGSMFCRSGDDFPHRIHRPSMSMPDLKTRPAYQEMEEMLPDRKVSVTSLLEVGGGASGNLNMETRFGGGSLLQKRQRKPTRRYIEESSYLKPRSCGGRLSELGSSLIHVALQEHDSEEYQYDLGSSPSESQDETSDDCVTRRSGKGGRSRRKHHRLWTLSEVMKLIDGVSQYGVGRWTEIKRLLFSSSAYRTSVDLKDKWRNLLRASGAQVQSKRQAEQGRKQALRPIPLAVLRRVNELAIIFPYPRERKSKLVNTSEPVASSPGTDPSLSRCRRVTRQHRKNLA
ncbi:hypothetical protein Syun_000873 [Stephania yunnanensis]|uniref:Uncharacterized protein n=1 Tax=Stephania yunnanensis TaxID=152371 RepID=A0AAP0LCQ8_9MAGN